MTLGALKSTSDNREYAPTAGAYFLFNRGSYLLLIPSSIFNVYKQEVPHINLMATSIGGG